MREPLDIAFLQVGGSDAFPLGFLHKKVVPFAIAAQAMEGIYEITCEGETARVSGDAVFLTPASVPLQITHHHVGDAFRARWVHFSFVLYQTIDITSLLALPLSISGRRGRVIGEVIESLQRGMQKAVMHETPLQTLSRAGRERERAWQLFRLLCEVATLHPWAMESLETGRRLQPLFQHLDAHLGEAIDVAKMAALARMSTSRLYSYFHDRLGATPMAYVSGLRLKRAAALLTRWNQPSVKEVAAATGFANASHLSREFKLRYGVGPREFREREAFARGSLSVLRPKPGR